MARIINAILVLAIFIVPVIALAAAEKQFSPYVDGKGNITLPSDLRTTWIHLGTWVAASRAARAAAGPDLGPTAPGMGLHEVYTQPESVRVYKKTGKWPDGTVIVQEVRAIQWEDLPTGHVMYAGEGVEWFVMVKDGKGRFKNNPSWGDGWGWALFRAADPKKNISTNYKSDCLGCHDVAKGTDLVFASGYPTLR